MKRLYGRWAQILLLVAVLAGAPWALAQTDPLPSWNDGPAKKAIVDFVQATTMQGGPQFVPPAERVATFDQDGTLWVEQPMYSQVMYCLERVPAVVKAKPELAEVEPFKTVMSGNREAMAKLTMKDLEGGTFTISNGGVYGSMLSTPILNPPQSGILGLHATQKRAVVVGDAVVVRPMMYVALSYDHRLIDGREAVQFLVRVKECVEDPDRILIEV